MSSPVSGHTGIEAGRVAHLAWECTRGTQNECDAERHIRSEASNSTGWWAGWLERSDEWRDEIGHETDAQSDDLVAKTTGKQA